VGAPHFSVCQGLFRPIKLVHALLRSYSSEQALEKMMFC
jgi:hypothetical protein